MRGTTNRVFRAFAALGEVAGLTLAVLIAGTAAAPVAAQQTSVGIQSSPQLFATHCALYAAGYEAELGDSGANPLRA